MRKVNAPRAVRPDQIAILVRRLAETSKSLQSLLADEVEAVLFPSGESFLLLPGQTSTRLAAEMQRTILDAIPAHLAVLDPDGKIIFVNKSWQRFVGQCEGPWKSIVGQNYVEHCELANHQFGSIGHRVATGIRKVLKVETSTFSLVHEVAQEGQNKRYRMTATSLGRADTIGAAVMYPGRNRAATGHRKNPRTSRAAGSGRGCNSGPRHARSH
jgi:PAS domain-containing protein